MKDGRSNLGYQNSPIIPAIILTFCCFGLNAQVRDDTHPAGQAEPEALVGNKKEGAKFFNFKKHLLRAFKNYTSCLAGNSYLSYTRKDYLDFEPSSFAGSESFADHSKRKVKKVK